MFAQGARGGVAYSNHLATFMRMAKVGLHESVVLERRGGALRGVGLFARDALDAGTSIAVVPNERLVCSDSLKSIGCSYPMPHDGEERRRLFELESNACSLSDGRQRGLISELLGCDEDAEWLELSWRIGLERCGSHSFWWGWLDGLPSERELADVSSSCVLAVRSRFPELAGELSRLSQRMGTEISEWYERLENELTMPPKPVFEWAVHIVLSRASVLIRPQNSEVNNKTVFVKKLGILPVIDACNTSNTIFIDSYEDRLEGFIDDTFAKAAKDIVIREGEGLPPSLSEERLRSAFLQLESLENPFFYTSSLEGQRHTSTSASRVGKQMLSSTAAADILINKGEVEIAPTWDALPRWYQELIIAETLETERASTVGMTSLGPLTEPPISVTAGLFPAFVLTLSRDVRAGEEILTPYDEVVSTDSLASICGGNSASKGNSHTERAMRKWLRYGISN